MPGRVRQLVLSLEPGNPHLVSEPYDIAYLFGLGAGSGTTLDQIGAYFIKQITVAVKELEQTRAHNRALH